MNEHHRNHFGLVIGGGIIGAIIGVVGALLLIKSSEDNPHLDSKQGFQLGLRIISVLQSLIQSAK